MLACVGQGGFAPVWRAEEVHEGKKLRDVAVKVFFLPDGILPGSPDAALWLDGVIEEARALCRVEHTSVVRFYTLHRDDALGLVGLVMEHVAGRNLGEVLRAEGPFDERKLLDVGISVAWALAAVHDAGLVHRDIKPENIIESATGYKLIDFGIVVDAPREPGQGPPPVFGTRGFVAPEYFDRRSHPSPAGDLYALGVTLLVLATATYQEYALNAVAERARATRRRGEVHSAADLIDILLDPDPATRPRHADWVARELERLRAGGQKSSEYSLGGAPAAARGLVGVDRMSIPSPGVPASHRGGAGDPGRARGTHRLSGAPEPGAGDTLHDPEPHPPFAGREDALAALDLAAGETRQGHTRLVLLTGPPGIGRTRLLEAAVERAGFAPERTLRAHASPERSSPLRPLVMALRGARDGGPFHLLERALDRALSPAVLPSPGQADEALEAVEDALLASASAGPTLLAIDDLQWADERTLKLLRLLAERTERGASASLLVIATARDEPHAAPSLRAFLGAIKGRPRRAARHIALGPLTAEQAARVAQGVLRIDPAVQHAAVRGSGRVPFFLVNALLAWRETGAIRWLDGAYRAAGEDLLAAPLPSVAALVEARLASCFEPGSPLARGALRALAVVAMYGAGLPLGILLGACADLAGVEEALETLVDASILTASGEPLEYGCAQEMVRQAVLNLVRHKPWFHRAQRALLDAVASMPDSSADPTFLALGYEKLGAREQASVWLARAMENALRAGLFAEAAELGDRLAALAPGDAARVDTVLDVVRALVRGRHVEEARRRLDGLAPPGRGRQDVRRRILRLEVARARAEAAGDPDLLADADALGDPVIACEARMALAGVAPGGEAGELVGVAVTLAQDLDPALEFAARVLRAELSYAADLPDPLLAEQDLRRALAIARQTSSIWQQIHIEGDLAVLEAELGRTSSAIDWLRRLAVQAEELGMKGQLRTLLNNLSHFLMRAGETEEGAAVALRTAVLAAEAGDPTLRGAALSLRADALLYTGKLDDALESADEAESLQRERDDMRQALTLLRRADILLVMGREEEALADARAAQESSRRHGERAFFLTAVLWEKLFLAQRSEVDASELREALAAARDAGVGQRPVRPRLIDAANMWLESSTEDLGPLDPKLSFRS